MSHACHRCWKCYKTFRFWSLLTRKWREHVVFLTFWLRNVLRATTASTFSTLQVLRALRSWSVLYILTSKCASRHNGMHFSDIATSKSGPNMVCFVHFDFEMCFPPQRRALFRHLNFGPSMVCFVHFDLETCFAPQRRAFFISHLASWLRTRRSSEPTFRPSGASNHRKNTVFRDFPTFSRTCIFFLLTLSLLWSSLYCSSLLFFDSYHLCFSSVHIVGSLTSKLPSTIEYCRTDWIKAVASFDTMQACMTHIIYKRTFNAHLVPYSLIDLIVNLPRPTLALMLFWTLGLDAF